MKKVFAAECHSVSGKDLFFDTTIAIGFDKEEVIQKAEAQYRYWTKKEKAERSVVVCAYDYLGDEDEFDKDLVDYESGYEEVFTVSD